MTEQVFHGSGGRVTGERRLDQVLGGKVWGTTVELGVLPRFLLDLETLSEAGRGCRNTSSSTGLVGGSGVGAGVERGFGGRSVAVRVSQGDLTAELISRLRFSRGDVEVAEHLNAAPSLSGEHGLIM